MTQFFFKDNLTFSSLAEMLDLPQAEKMEMQKRSLAGICAMARIF